MKQDYGWWLGPVTDHQGWLQTVGEDLLNWHTCPHCDSSSFTTVCQHCGGDILHDGHQHRGTNADF